MGSTSSSQSTGPNLPQLIISECESSNSYVSAPVTLIEGSDKKREQLEHEAQPA